MKGEKEKGESALNIEWKWEASSVNAEMNSK